MLLLLLVIFCFRLLDGCMPMVPPDDIECPSPPVVAALPMNTTDTLYTAFPSPTTAANGDREYKCKFTMTRTGVPETKYDDAKLICKPNSGLYVLKTADGKEETVPSDHLYQCQEKACPPVSTIQSTEELDDQLERPYGKGVALTTIEGAESIVAYCPEEDYLHDISDPANPVRLRGNDAPFCKRNSGVWSPNSKDFRCLYLICARTYAVDDIFHCPPSATCDHTKFMSSDGHNSCEEPFVMSAFMNETFTTFKWLQCKWEFGYFYSENGGEYYSPKLTCVQPPYPKGNLRQTRPEETIELCPNSTTPCGQNETIVRNDSLHCNTANCNEEKIAADKAIFGSDRVVKDYMRGQTSD